MIENTKSANVHNSTEFTILFSLKIISRQLIRFLNFQRRLMHTHKTEANSVRRDPQFRCRHIENLNGNYMVHSKIIETTNLNNQMSQGDLKKFKLS